jgi:hypothetical protein
MQDSEWFPVFALIIEFDSGRLIPKLNDLRRVLVCQNCSQLIAMTLELNCSSHLATGVTAAYVSLYATDTPRGIGLTHLVNDLSRYIRSQITSTPLV